MMINDMKKNELTEQEMNEVAGGYMEPAATNEELLKNIQELFGTDNGFVEDLTGVHGNDASGSW